MQKFVVAPAIIEQSNFDGGYAPDPESEGADANILPDMLNLLPDVGGSQALVTRKGFKRLREELVGLSTHYVKHIWPFRGDGTSYLICVLSDDSDSPDNIRLYAINLEDDSVERIDTAGRTWENPDRNHWGMNIQEVFYGGSPGNDMYSWDPATGTWDDTANTGEWDEIVDNLTPGANQVARDFAFTGKERVTYQGSIYKPVDGIRYDTWENGQEYVVGDRVSLRIAIGGYTYWRSYKCTTSHTAVTATDRPGDGSSWQTNWKKVRLPLPVNEDGETSDKWYFVPVAPGTSVAAWHANRLWLRYDEQGDKSRLLYSAPTEPEKGMDVPDVVFDPTDFAPGNDMSGPGGGWIQVNDGRKEGVIEAIHSYGTYLLVFKRQATWVITGQSEESFTLRRLARHVGCVGPECVVELNGLVYFLSDDGLYVTDGTAVEPVLGNEKVSQTLSARIDAMHAEGAAGNLRDPNVWVYQDMVWFSLPASGETEPEWTWVYDPKRQAFYKTNLPVLSATTARHEGIPKFYFSAPGSYSDRDLVYVYDHPDAVSAGVDKDDTGLDAYAQADIAWHARTSWWPFGLLREQRRIRRTWAVVKGVLTFTLTWFRDWNDSDTGNVARVVSTSVAQHIEGEWFPDSHAVSFKVSATAAPAVLYGIAADTQRRRARYHVT